MSKQPLETKKATSVAVSLKAVHSTSGPKLIFPHFLSVNRVWHIYVKKQFLIFQYLIFALLQAKIAFWPNSVRLPTYEIH